MALAIIGGILVTKFKPPPGKPHRPGVSGVAPGYIDVTTRTYHIS
jgi:hypothetical protein